LGAAPEERDAVREAALVEENASEAEQRIDRVRAARNSLAKHEFRVIQLALGTQNNAETVMGLHVFGRDRNDSAKRRLGLGSFVLTLQDQAENPIGPVMAWPAS
jgi:hypothetical protein